MGNKALMRFWKRKKPANPHVYWLFWRSGWDSNPRAVSDKLISSQPRYDLFDTSPNIAPIIGARCILSHIKQFCNSFLFCGGAEAAVTDGGYAVVLGYTVGGEYPLRYGSARAQGHGFIGGVNELYHYMPLVIGVTVVAVDNAYRVGKADTQLEPQATAGIYPHIRGINKHGGAGIQSSGVYGAFTQEFCQSIKIGPGGIDSDDGSFEGLSNENYRYQ